VSILSPLKNKKLHPETFPRLKISPKCVCGRGSAPDLTGKLTALPRPPSCIRGGEKRGKTRGKEGKGGERREKEGKGGKGGERRGKEGKGEEGEERKVKERRGREGKEGKTPKLQK